MKSITIGGGEMPDELKDLLGSVLGGKKKATPVAASMVQLRALLEAASQKPLVIGDIVVLREEFEFKFPNQGERCIVTQALSVPYRSGEAGTTETSECCDIALGFANPETGKIVECLYDSRKFVKVGSIYDPVVTASGEQIPVE